MTVPIAKKGDRVGAIMSADDTTVYLLGYGVYEDDVVVEYLDDFTFEQAEATASANLKLLGIEWPPEMDTPEKRHVKFLEFKASPLYTMARTHPKLRLDNGEVVYGLECHFGPEEFVKNAIKDRRIQRVILSRKQNGEPDQEIMAGTA
jgi:hypothetical protein